MEAQMTKETKAAMRAFGIRRQMIVTMMPDAMIRFRMSSSMMTPFSSQKRNSHEKGYAAFSSPKYDFMSSRMVLSTLYR